MAVACDRVVEVGSETDEITQVTAESTGLVTWKQFVAPVRVRRGGIWVPVNVNLQAGPDGRIAPLASTVDIQFSRGGTDPLVTVSAAGGSASLSWPFPLPIPQLEGATAIYAEVWPGVDLRVRATVVGFTHVLVVKDAAAADNPNLREVRYDWRGNGLTIRQRVDVVDSLEIVDGSGAVVFSSAPATMWDSAPAIPEGGAAMLVLGNEGDSLSAGVSTAESPGDLANVAPVGVTASSTQMVVTPQPGLLDDPNAVFPLYIDPSFPATRQKFAYSNQNGVTNTDEWARVGMSPTAGHGIWRSFFHLELGPSIAYKPIVSAKVNAVLYQSHSCVSQPTGLWSSADIPVGVPNGGAATWSGMTLTQHLAEDSGRANLGAVCAGGSPDDLAMEFTGEPLRVKVQGWVNLNWSYTSLALSGKRADGTFESNVSSWKRFYWAQTSMSITYNYAPNMPTIRDFAATEAFKDTKSITKFPRLLRRRRAGGS